MFNKYKNKKKFVDRGVYFITDGEFKGAFIMNIKEADVGNQKAMMMLPDKETLMMSTEQVKKLFEDGHFEFVKTVPKKHYKVCVAEYRKELKS